MSKLLAQARLQACRRWPFASHAILSMVPVPRPGLGTLAVDQHWRLYYDESVLERIGPDQAAGVILHELDHLLKRHHKRGKSIVSDDKWELWNYATDASINGDLRKEGVPLPEGVVYPEKFDLPNGLCAEEYFRKLSDQQENKDGDQTTDDSQGDEEPSSDAGSSADNEGTDDQDDAGASEPAAGSPDRLEHPCGEDEAAGPVEPQHIGSSGSCSDGQPRPWELGSPDEDNPGLDEADQEQLAHVTAKNVLEKECGKGAGGHRRWAEDILNPPVDPAAKLLNLVRRYCDVTVGMGDRSYRRPSRRNGNPRMVLPSNVAPLPRITVIVDTSSSMDAEDLGLALGMIRKVLNSFRIRDGIKVITGDTQGQTKQLCLSDPSKIDLAGGGGTNMAQVVEGVLEDRPKPQIILVCTDGWTRWPAEEPGIPVVACVTNKLSDVPDCYERPSWMTTISLKGDLR